VYLVAYLLAALSVADAGIRVERDSAHAEVLNGPRPTCAGRGTRKRHSAAGCFGAESAPMCEQNDADHGAVVSSDESDDLAVSSLAPRCDNYPGKMIGTSITTPAVDSDFSRNGRRNLNLI